MKREREPNLVAELEALLRTAKEADAFQSVIVEMLDRVDFGADAAERRDRERLAIMVDAMSRRRQARHRCSTRGRDRTSPCR